MDYIYLLKNKDGQNKMAKKLKNKKLLWIIPIILVIGIVYLISSNTEEKIPCTEVFENGKLISDSCSSGSFCVTGVYSSDNEVMSGKRVEAQGFCKKENQGSGFIGI